MPQALSRIRETFEYAKEAADAHPRLDLMAIREDGSAALLLGPRDFICECKLAAAFPEVVRDPALASGSDWILVKRGSLTVDDVTRPFHYVTEPAQKLMGGPNALTRTLIGGALGGLGGYAAGAAYDTIQPYMVGLLPEDMQDRFEPTNMRKHLGILGAGLGATPGLVQTGVSLHNGHSPLTDYPWKSAELDPAMWKVAEDAGALFVPSIPVDAFNRAVWSDVAVPQNPFGTKSMWGDNSQAMHTPPAAAAAVSGLVAAAGAARNSEFVSPWDIAKTVANLGVNAGIGGLSGMAAGIAAGKTLQVLTGLDAESQKQLRQNGMWAGIITGIARKVF